MRREGSIFISVDHGVSENGVVIISNKGHFPKPPRNAFIVTHVITKDVFKAVPYYLSDLENLDLEDLMYSIISTGKY